MERMRVAARPGEARCAYCHDALRGEVVTCAACGTLVHPGCQLDRCPTLGCDDLSAWAWTTLSARPAAPRPRGPRRRGAQPHRGLVAAGLAIAGACSFALGVAVVPWITAPPERSPAAASPRPTPSAVEVQLERPPSRCKPEVHSGTGLPKESLYFQCNEVMGPSDQLPGANALTMTAR